MKHDHSHHQTAGSAPPSHAHSEHGSGGATASKRDQHGQNDSAHEHHGDHTERHRGHDKHEGHSPDMFRAKFWLSLLLTIPTIIWGHMLMQVTGWHAPAFPGSVWIPPVFGTAVFLYGGLVFLRGAGREIADRLPGMMTLISLAITVAFVFSAVVTLGYEGMPLWEELATLVTIMLLGHWMEMRSIHQAQGALKELAKLMPSTANRVIGDRMETVDVSALKAGDLVLIRPGEAVPADGVVAEGTSAVNEAMLTGESRPVHKNAGDDVIGGTVNGSGALRVTVSKTGEQTALAGIMRLVEQAQGSRSGAQALADRAAFWLTIVALASAVITMIAWLIADATGSYIVERVVTVLVIACPHALGLAIPLVVAISTTIGARNGLLVRDRRGLEEARLLDAVVFDKTGTLTRGEQRVVAIGVSGVSEEDALRLAAAIERNSEHPVARAVVSSAEERGLTLPEASDFGSTPGVGISGVVEGRKLDVGGPNLLRSRQIETEGSIRRVADEAARNGQAAIYVLDQESVLAVFAVADEIRSESKDAVNRLRSMGIRVAMLTGDARAVAESVASQLGIDTVFAEVLPDQKVDRIRELQSAGKRVAMIGDGVNDAPALITADVGIAIGAGTDVAVEAGDVVLVRSDPRDIPRIIELSRASYRKMVQNLWWAAGYNVVAIPLAAGALAHWGIVLAPAVGAVLMSASTLIVAANAQLLRRIQL